MEELEQWMMVEPQNKNKKSTSSTEHEEQEQKVLPEGWMKEDEEEEEEECSAETNLFSYCSTPAKIFNNETASKQNLKEEKSNV